MWDSFYHEIGYWNSRYYRGYRVIGNRRGGEPPDMVRLIEEEDEEILAIIMAFMESDT